MFGFEEPILKRDSSEESMSCTYQWIFKLRKSYPLKYSFTTLIFRNSMEDMDCLNGKFYLYQNINPIIA